MDVAGIGVHKHQRHIRTRPMISRVSQVLGKQVLAEVAMIMKPETILTWPWKLATQKFDGFQWWQVSG
jgi:hypothetical protein